MNEDLREATTASDERIEPVEANPINELQPLQLAYLTPQEPAWPKYRFFWGLLAGMVGGAAAAMSWSLVILSDSSRSSFDVLMGLSFMAGAIGGALASGYLLITVQAALRHPLDVRNRFAAGSAVAFSPLLALCTSLAGPVGYMGAGSIAAMSAVLAPMAWDRFHGWRILLAALLACLPFAVGYAFGVSTDAWWHRHWQFGWKWGGAIFCVIVVATIAASIVIAGSRRGEPRPPAR